MSSLHSAFRFILVLVATLLPASSFAADPPTKFKGLWLGMPFAEVPPIIKQLLPRTYELKGAKFKDGVYEVDILPVVYNSDLRGFGRFMVSAEKTVFEIYFDHWILNELFKTGKMTDEEIMRGLAEGYGLSRWQLEVIDNKDWSVARTKTGERLALLRERGGLSLKITKDPLAAGAKSNFN